MRTTRSSAGTGGPAARRPTVCPAITDWGQA